MGTSPLGLIFAKTELTEAMVTVVLRDVVVAVRAHVALACLISLCSIFAKLTIQRSWQGLGKKGLKRISLVFSSRT